MAPRLAQRHGVSNTAAQAPPRRRYALNQWTELTRFLEDGAIELDNNRAERQLRTIAVGRAYAHSFTMRTRPRRMARSFPERVKDPSVMST